MDSVEEIVAHLQAWEKKMMETAKRLREGETVPHTAIQAVPLEGSVAAVDSGFLAARFHGVDVVVVRGAAVNFTYHREKLETVMYHPSKNPPLYWEAQMGLDEGEALAFRQIVRLQKEITHATEILEAMQPGVLLLDGSLLPLPSDKPVQESALFVPYQKLMAMVAALFEKAKRQQCALIGGVKDTRARRWVATMDGFGNDSLFFHYYLEAGEKTEAVTYDETILGKQVKILYMKPSSEDLPLRIEFLDNTDEEKIAGTIFGLTAISPNHAYPAPLVEADLRAMVLPEEMERLEQRLHLRLPFLHTLRRNDRPFR